MPIARTARQASNHCALAGGRAFFRSEAAPGPRGLEAKVILSRAFAPARAAESAQPTTSAAA